MFKYFFRTLFSIVLITFLSFTLNSCSSLSHNENVDIFVPIISIGIIGGIGTFFIRRGISRNNERRKVQNELEEQRRVELERRRQIENERIAEQRRQEEERRRMAEAERQRIAEERRLAQQEEQRVEQARLAELYRQGGSSIGNLRNTAWRFYQPFGNTYLQSRIDFGDGNYIRQSNQHDIWFARTERGTFRVNGDTVIFLTEGGQYSYGTIIGNTLTIETLVFTRTL